MTLSRCRAMLKVGEASAQHDFAASFLCITPRPPPTRTFRHRGAHSLTGCSGARVFSPVVLFSGRARITLVRTYWYREGTPSYDVRSMGRAARRRRPSFAWLYEANTGRSATRRAGISDHTVRSATPTDTMIAAAAFLVSSRGARSSLPHFGATIDSTTPIRKTNTLVVLLMAWTRLKGARTSA